VKPWVQQLGSGPDLVLLHGWALHGGMWGPMVEALAERHRLHILDLPGHGRSPWSPSIRSLGDMAAIVHAALPERPTLLGWSLGGMLALEIARRWPQKVAALALVATTPRFVATPGWDHGMSPEVLDGFARSLAEDHRRTVQNFLSLQVRGDEHATSTLRRLRRELEAHGPPKLDALAAGLAVLRETDLRGSLAAIDAPALVISGEYDRLTPPGAGAALASALCTAGFVSIPGSGHAPFISHPLEFLGALLPFLARQGTQP
jgi:pimeloyl-[acyl-carrier protein] methyl ester esterase